jgi:hypothetical protein
VLRYGFIPGTATLLVFIHDASKHHGLEKDRRTLSVEAVVES